MKHTKKYLGIAAAGILSYSVFLAGCNWEKEKINASADAGAEQETETAAWESTWQESTQKREQETEAILDVSEIQTEETETTDQTDAPYEVEMQIFRKDEQCDISYPQIVGWELSDKQQEWNAAFEKCVENAILDIGENDKVSVYFEIEEQSEELLSMTVNYYYEMEGGAHPSAAIKTFNVNMQTGEKVTFADLADPRETAQLLFQGSNGSTVLSDAEISVQDILSYNYIWMEPTKEALAGSLSHFDGETEDYGANETMGCSFRRNGKVCLVFYVSHAMGDYAVVQLE